MKEYDLFTFANGIRFVHKEVTHTKVAHCAMMLDIGSRDEKPHQIGLAHFWEHMAFKGTKNRKAYQILTKLDELGGELNAYTTKEKICFHASVLYEHFEKAVDLLSDITFNSVFPEKEINKERLVILEEMSMYEDDPADAITDEFDDVIFKGHSLGNNILGTRESVSKFEKQDFDNFLTENLDTSRIVFVSVSNIPFKKALKTVSKYLADIPTISRERQRINFKGVPAQQITVKKAVNRVYCAIGTETYSLFDPKRVPFFLLSNILGGPASNSRLNLSIREKYGFVYSIDAGVNFFTDTGIFAIFYATEQKTYHRCNDLVMKELKKMRNEQLTRTQIHKAKQQMLGQLAMAEESNHSLMMMFAKSILDMNEVQTLDSLFQEIEAITPQMLQEVADEMFAEDRLSQLLYIPKE
jgi:predicted Zn-dependent peptidase